MPTNIMSVGKCHNVIVFKVFDCVSSHESLRTGGRASIPHPYL